MEEDRFDSETGSVHDQTENIPQVNKICPRCGKSNLPAAVYCYNCGLKLPESTLNKKICIGCGAENEVSSEYCYKCGLKLPDKPGDTGSFYNRYAGFWIRLLAALIDGIIVGIVSNVITLPFLGDFYGSSYLYEWNTGAFYDTIDFETFWLSWWIATLVSLLLPAIYYTVAVGRWGTTIGKMALGMKIVRSDGSRVSYWRAFGRFWAHELSWMIFGIGHIMIAFTSKKQGLHDMICDTIVVKKD